MPALLLVCAVVLMLALLGVGIWAEVRRITVNALLMEWGVYRWAEAWRAAYAGHPWRGLALLESAFWLAFLFPLLDMALDPRFSRTANLVWWLTIGPHEIGHLLCLPFGRFLMVAGGAFWQLAWWGGLAVYSVFLRRHVRLGLLFALLTGFSALNLSVYIRDARERDLPLLFGLGEDSHDWYNLLRWLGLLRYDDFFGDVALMSGVGLVLGVLYALLWWVWCWPTRGGRL